MDQKTVLLLNQLNQNFYNQSANSFSDARQHPWPGWKQLTPLLSSIFQLPTSTVLDLACGNGRFLKFLTSKLPNNSFRYIGIDSDDKLLKQAKQSNETEKATFIQLDIINELVNRNLKLSKADIIVAFGLMHHVPSFDLRLKLLKTLANELNDNGLLIVSFWKFAEIPRLKNKTVSQEQVAEVLPELNLKELEAGDYFLGWQGSQKVLRYCHSFSDDEVRNYTKQLSLKKVADFRADGKEGRVNQYIVWEKYN